MGRKEKTDPYEEARPAVPECERCITVAIKKRNGALRAVSVRCPAFKRKCLDDVIDAVDQPFRNTTGRCRYR